MAENSVKLTADLSNIDNFEACRTFFVKLHEKESTFLTVEELRKLISAQNMTFSPEDFTQHEYLSNLEGLKFNNDKMTVKLEFIAGGGVVDFCNELYDLFTDMNAKRVRITAVDDNDFDKIDWKTEGKNSSSDPFAEHGFKRPRLPIRKRANGAFNAIAPTGEVMARIHLKSGHLCGVQQILSKKDGSVALSFEYKNGVPHGEVVIDHADGKPAIRSNYSNGVLHGNAYLKCPEGHLSKSANFVRGKLHGPQLIHKPGDEVPMFEAEYLNGELEGTVSLRKPDGEVISADFEKGKPTNDIHPHEYIAIMASEGALIPHRKFLNFIDPSLFYGALKKMNLKKIK